MNKQYNDIEDLIGKYFAGEASNDEIAIVESWRKENAANQKQFEQYKTIFSNASAIPAHQQFDTDAAWNKMKSKLQVKNPGKVVRMRPEVAISKAFLRLAASIVILITAGFFTYRIIFPERDRVQIASKNLIVSDTLPDGTNVVVNRQSKVLYSFNSRSKEHVVKLAGEAYFTIDSKNNNSQNKKKFVVEAGGLTIRDIGTSFNVRAYPKSDTVQVYVQEGEVIIDADDGNDPIHVKANESVTFVRGEKLFSTAEPQPNTVAYKTRFFVFANQSLDEVVRSINDVYEKHIVISDSLKNCRLTVTFNNEDVDEIASVIAETLGLTVHNAADHIKLEGKGCE